MSIFSASISTLGAAFDPEIGDGLHRETARILRGIAAKVEAGETDGTARDGNGNTCAAWSFTFDDVDRESSASRQHYIDTGRYLKPGEADEIDSGATYAATAIAESIARTGRTSWADRREISGRLEELRAELRAERISFGELAELASLAEHIDPGDVELLEAAGVPEHFGDRVEVAAVALAAEMRAAGVRSVTEYHEVCDANEAIDQHARAAGLDPFADDHAAANMVTARADVIAGRRAWLAENLDEIEGWTDDPDHVEQVKADPCPGRFLLVETGVRDGRFWLTTHDSLEDAWGYHRGQEYREDWAISYAVDLHTGTDHHPAGSVAVWEPGR